MTAFHILLHLIELESIQNTELSMNKDRTTSSINLQHLLGQISAPSHVRDYQSARSTHHSESSVQASKTNNNVSNAPELFAKNSFQIGTNSVLHRPCGSVVNFGTAFTYIKHTG